MSAERRDSYRATVTPGAASVHLPSAAADDTAVVDLSAGGAALFVPSAALPALEGAAIEICPAGRDPIRARVGVVSAREDQLQPGHHFVGVRFGGISRRALGSLSQFIIERYLDDEERATVVDRDQRVVALHDPQRIHHALRSLAVDGQLLHARCQHSTFDLRARTVGTIDGRHGVIAVPLLKPGTRLRPGAVYTFDMPGSFAMHRFRSTIEPTPVPGEVLVPAPVTLLKQGFRGSERLRGNELPLAVQHPRLRGAHLVKQIHDLSAGGLSFLINPRVDALFPGERVVLEVGDGEIWAEGTLRTFGRLPNTEDLLCGVEFQRWPQREHAERWQQLVFRQAHPGVEPGEGAEAGQQAWELLESSHYVEEATAEIRGELETSFKAAWGAVTRKSRFDRLLVARDGDRAVGTVSGSLLYPGTWMMHHAGVDRDMRRASKQRKFQICYDLYAGIAHTLYGIEDAEHVIAFVDANKPFNHLVFNRFLDDYPTAEDYVFGRIDIFKTNPQKWNDRDAPHPDGVTVQTGDEQLDQQLAQFLAERLPPVTTAAMSLSESTISLADFTKRYAARGICRARRLFHALHKGRPVAAVVADIGGEGTNIFNLFNMCWFVPLEGWAAKDWHVKRVLIDHAMRFYRDNAALELLFVEPPSSPAEQQLVDYGFGPAIQGVRWIAKKVVLPFWKDHLNDLFHGLAGDD